MESSIVALRPGRIADLQQRVKAADKKLAKLLKPKPAKTVKPKTSAGKKRAGRTFEQLGAQAVRAAESRARKIHNVTRRRADLARRPGAATRGVRSRIPAAHLLWFAQAVQRPTPPSSERLRLARRLAGDVAREARLAVLRARLERRKRVRHVKLRLAYR